MLSNNNYQTENFGGIYIVSCTSARARMSKRQLHRVQRESYLMFRKEGVRVGGGGGRRTVVSGRLALRHQAPNYPQALVH